MKRRTTNRKKGFTLIELMLVLVILGVLAALVVPKFTGRSKQAKETAAKTDITRLANAVALFETDTGRFPSTDEGLEALVKQPANVTTWHQLLTSVPKDPWGNAYHYQQPGQHDGNGFDLFSAGEDGREGTDDDIGNWDKSQQ